MSTETKPTIIHNIGHSRVVHAIAAIAVVGLLNQAFAWHNQNRHQQQVQQQQQQVHLPPLTGYAPVKKIDTHIFRSSKLGLPKAMMPTHGFNTCTEAPAWDNCVGAIVDLDARTIQSYSIAWAEKPEDRKFSTGVVSALSPQDFAILVEAANRDWNPGAPVPWTGGWLTGVCSVQLFDKDDGRNDDFSPSCKGSAVLDALERIKETSGLPVPLPEP